MLWSRSANRARGDCQLRGSRAERLLSRRNSPWSTPAPAHCTSPGPRVAGATLAARSNAPHPRCHFPPGSITPYRGTYLSRFLSGTRPWASVVGPDVPRESLPTHRRSTPRSRLTVPAWVRASDVWYSATAWYWVARFRVSFCIIFPFFIRFRLEILGARHLFSIF